jgi:plastocyanin
MRRHFVSSTVCAFLAIGMLALDEPGSRAADNGTVTGTVTAKGLATNSNVIVSLQAPGLVVKSPAAPVEIDQKGKIFVPHVLAVVTGTTVKFLNSDPFEHNVFSPEGRYDLGTWPQGQAKQHTFTKAGVSTQLCRIHPEMEGFIVVLDTPYFAKTDQAGAFQIANVPPGRYTLVAWSEKLKETKQAVVVEAGKSSTVQITLSK